MTDRTTDPTRGADRETDADAGGGDGPDAGDAPAGDADGEAGGTATGTEDPDTDLDPGDADTDGAEAVIDTGELDRDLDLGPDRDADSEFGDRDAGPGPDVDAGTGTTGGDGLAGTLAGAVPDRVAAAAGRVTDVLPDRVTGVLPAVDPGAVTDGLPSVGAEGGPVAELDDLAGGTDLAGEDDAALAGATPRERAAVRRVRLVGFVLDDLIPVPGTDRRVGIDPVLSVVPVSGDAVGAAIGGYVVIEAVRLGLPPTTIARMVLNIALDFGGGSLPVVGPLFDAAFRANAKNAELLERAVREGARDGPLD